MNNHEPRPIKVINTDAFYDWLETCPVEYRFVRLDEDYVEFGFFSVKDHNPETCDECMEEE